MRIMKGERERKGRKEKGRIMRKKDRRKREKKNMRMCRVDQ